MKKINKVAAFLLGGGALLSLILCNNSLAAGSSRQSNIQSHGTYVSNAAETDDEVVLCSADLRYLADECDKLETMIDGLSQTQGANISYEYHYHTGNMYVKGGCYNSGYHAHSGCEYHTHGDSCYTTKVIHTHSGKPGACWTQTRIHTHTDSCYSKTGTKRCPCSSSQGDDGYGTKCYTCGHDPHASNCCCATVDDITRTCGKDEFKYTLKCEKQTTETVLSCTKSVGYQCGYLPINRWSTTCGRRDGEIVKATITF